MLWGCFASTGTGDLQRVEGNINSCAHQEILEKNAMPSVRELRPEHNRWLQQENDPKHWSKSTQAWFRKRVWMVLECLSQSPDLNPIENLWWDLTKAVAGSKPRNVTELEAFAKEEWARNPN